jgi:hypothetical protein
MLLAGGVPGGADPPVPPNMPLVALQPLSHSTPPKYTNDNHFDVFIVRLLEMKMLVI